MNKFGQSITLINFMNVLSPLLINAQHVKKHGHYAGVIGFPEGVGDPAQMWGY